MHLARPSYLARPTHLARPSPIGVPATRLDFDPRSDLIPLFFFFSDQQALFSLFNTFGRNLIHFRPRCHRNCTHDVGSYFLSPFANRSRRSGLALRRPRADAYIPNDAHFQRCTRIAGPGEARSMATTFRGYSYSHILICADAQ